MGKRSVILTNTLQTNTANPDDTAWRGDIYRGVRAEPKSATSKYALACNVSELFLGAGPMHPQWPFAPNSLADCRGRALVALGTPRRPKWPPHPPSARKRRPQSAAKAASGGGPETPPNFAANSCRDFLKVLFCETLSQKELVVNFGAAIGRASGRVFWCRAVKKL